MNWQFWIDVGGTFTDCIARDPAGVLQQHKVLSSGDIHGSGILNTRTNVLTDNAREHDPENFWVGAACQLWTENSEPSVTSRVLKSGGAGELRLALADQHLETFGRDPLPSAHPPQQFSTSPDELGTPTADAHLQADCQPVRYVLNPGLPAPVLAIRYLLQLCANEAVPPVTIRFGTTRGTNALLTRTGAKTLLITTAGFADAPLIGNQSRPELFALNIVKSAPLFSGVIEIEERVAADGTVLVDFSSPALQTSELQTPELQTSELQLPGVSRVCSPQQLTDALIRYRRQGFASVAICLMNAYVNDRHERQIADLATAAGFDEVSRSTEVSPLIRFLPRCDTTTLDAYLNPVLRGYLTSIQSCLPGSDIRVMTSSGGLVHSGSFRGKDSLLSGPAGGIVGFASIARAEGFDKAIGFDMGGTSTDVARYDGRFEFENEIVKAGVRIMTPVLAIETVAAGGGSLCGFDGTRLFVGPQSAGAQPGPACYGAGGPLTVTDLNVFLGRIPPEHFPFPLHVDAIHQRLTALRTEMVMAEVVPEQHSLHVLAEGLLQIANDNMANAIRKVSIARGYNPTDYVLVSFGGAGGQHACSVASRLGIQQVLLHPLSGVLSAYGMGMADVRAIRQQSILKPLNHRTPEYLVSVFQTLSAAAVEEVKAQGISADQILPSDCIAELRYLGTDATLQIPLEVSKLGPPANSDEFPDQTSGATCSSGTHPHQSANDRLRPERFAASRQVIAAEIRSAFEAEHQRLYGYIRPDRDIEVAIASVEVVGRSESVIRGTSFAEPAPTECNLQRQPHDHPAPHAVDSTGSVVHGHAAGSITTWFDHQPQTTVVYLRHQLQAGQQISGPAILCESTSTIVVEPGCMASIQPSGAVLIRVPVQRTISWRSLRPDAVIETETTSHAGSVSELDTAAPSRDPVLLEIFSNQFTSIAEQMGEMLRRTAISTNVRERLDYSCALFDQDGQLVVNAPHVPVHLGAMGETVRALMEDHPLMLPGDVYVSNDPYRGGSHLPDVTVVTPVFPGPDSRPAFFVANRAHHAEIGGIRPGSMPPMSSNLAEEGVLICSRKLVDQGQSCENELRELLTSGPWPSRAVDDNLADLAAQVAANACGARLIRDLVTASSIAAVQACMKQLQQTSADRMRSALRQLGDCQKSFAESLDDGTPICVTITIRQDHATIDFTGSGDVHRGNLNANRAITTAATLYTLRCLLDADIPLNAGVLQPITLIIPAGILNPSRGASAELTPAVVGGNVETSQRIVNVLSGALQLAAASQGTMNNLTFGDDSFGYYETIGGGAGATRTARGADAIHTHMTNTRLTDPEILEQRYPVRLRQLSIRRGSGGAGQHRGGDGMIREIEFLRPVHVSMLCQSFARPPYGMQGGSAGQTGQNLLFDPATGQFLRVGGSFHTTVAAGARLRIETPGGGGWGRDAAANSDAEPA